MSDHDMGRIMFGPLPQRHELVSIAFDRPDHVRQINQTQQRKVGGKWDGRFLALAELVATWSKDPSSHVAAVIVDSHNRIVSLGFNGPPKGVAEAKDRDQKLMRTIHAEANALHFASRSVEGCTLYVTHPPCAHCAGHAIQRGIKRVVFPHPDPEFLVRWKDSFNESLEMLAEAGVEVFYYGEEK